MTAPERRDGLLILDGWHGRSRSPVVIVGETPTRYRITPPEGVDRVRLGGRGAGRAARVGVGRSERARHRLTFTSGSESAPTGCGPTRRVRRATRARG